MESQLAQQDVFDYCVANVAEKAMMLEDNTVKGSQFKQPLLEFSGSCAGCAETTYARLITQLFGDRMYISNATGCSSIWGGPAATSPYTANKERPRPRLVQLPVRGQRRARSGHVSGSEAQSVKSLVEKIEPLIAETDTRRLRPPRHGWTLEDWRPCTSSPSASQGRTALLPYGGRLPQTLTAAELGNGDVLPSCAGRASC